MKETAKVLGDLSFSLLFLIFTSSFFFIIWVLERKKIRNTLKWIIEGENDVIFFFHS